MNYTCDKCSGVQHTKNTVRAYSDAKKTFVYLCFMCAHQPKGYHLTSFALRKMGVKLDIPPYYRIRPMK